MSIALGAGLLACLFHFGFFLMESVFWGSAKINKVFGVSPEMAHSRELKSFAFNMGFYNLFLSLSTLTGLYAVASQCCQGSLLLHSGCLFMIGAGLVLWVSSNFRKTLAAVIQGLPPAVCLIAYHLGH